MHRRIARLVFGVALAVSLVPRMYAGTLQGSFGSIAAGSNVNLTVRGALDWVHWGLYTDSSVNRKACACAEPYISNFTLLGDTNGFLAAYQYTDNFNGYSWSDGDPVVNVTNTTTGVWAYGWPSSLNTGFELTVPADTTTRILEVYVGAYAARGKLEASLSDGSAPNFVSGVNATVNNTSNGPSGVFTLTFAANSSGQTLTVRWTLALVRGAGGNVTLQAAILTAPGANNRPYVALTQPLKNMNFAAPASITLNADARDVDGTIRLVEFYAGTNKLGEDTTSPYSLTWTGVPVGRYCLTATATDNQNASVTSAPVKIFVYGTGGSLAGSAAMPPAAVDLTGGGTEDWAHWGLRSGNSFDRKDLVPRKISDFTRLGTNVVRSYADNYTAFSWSDGTPTLAESGTPTGVFIYGLTNGFQVTLPADTTTRRLRMYVGGYGAQGEFQAYVSDLSAPVYSDTSVSNVYGNSYTVYTLDYAAASSGQSLQITYRTLTLFDVTFGNVTLQAATLQGAPSDPLPVFLANPKYEGGTFTLSFFSQPNHTYTVQYTPSLAPTNWQVLTNLLGTGAILNVTNGAVAAPQQFYRVLTQ